MKQNLNLLIRIFRGLQIGIAFLLIYSLVQLIKTGTVDINFLGQNYGIRNIKIDEGYFISIVLFFLPYTPIIIAFEKIIFSLKEIKQDRFFSYELIKKIRSVGLLFLLTSLILLIVNFSVLYLSAFKGSTSMEVALILFILGLCCNVVAKVLTRARTLHQENKLTI